MAAVQQEIPPVASNFGSCTGIVDKGVELPKLVGVHCTDNGTGNLVKSESSPNGSCRRRNGPYSDSKVSSGCDNHSSGEGDGHRPSCHRNLAAEFEKDLTFRPKLNEISLRMVSRNPRANVPVVHRLLEGRKSLKERFEENLTFAPKLNALSLKLAQERTARMPEVQARMVQLAAVRAAEAYAQYTFKPHVSERSLRIAEGLGTSFQARQQIHLERRQKMMDEAYTSPPFQLTRRKRHLRLIPRVPHTTNQDHPANDNEAAISRLTHELTQEGKSSPTKSASHLGTSSQDSSTLQNASRHSFSGKSPRRQHKRTSSVPGTPSPDKLSKRERMRRRSYTSPQPKAPACADLSLKFEELSDGDRVKRVRVVAERITRSKKVFLLRGGYKMIQKCLRRRGWVEQDYKAAESVTPTATSMAKKLTPKIRKRHSSQASDSSSDGSDVSDLGDQGSDEEYSDEEEYCMLSRAVRSATPNFVWTLRRDDVLYRSLHRDTIVNHFAKASSFTTKVGLCTNLRNLLWFGDKDPNTFYPRCYRFSCEEEKEAFIDDYRFTTALCILKAVVEQHSTHPASQSFTINMDLALQHREAISRCSTPASGVHDRTSKADSIQSEASEREEKTTPGNQKPSRAPSRPSSKAGSRPPSRAAAPSPSPSYAPRPAVPEQAVKLAIKACEAYLSSKEHEDIEGSQCQLCPKLTVSEWTTLIQQFYTITYNNGVIVCGYQLVGRAEDILTQIGEHFPQLHMDGSRNIWIVKPGALSRGRGIVCLGRLEEMLELVSSQVQRKENKWVVQKYIERPLLIHDTKFDIRQWFLVTDWNPLTMWMYKDCYLRFSTQPYTLENLDQSVHLCNNSIQKYFENSADRSELVPDENMWDSDTFQVYLQSLGEGDKWDTVIYPGMKQALIHVLQVTQDEIEQRKNAFELYGADFMISEDFKPWLIEINCSPTMESSTSVTSTMCRQVMEDTIKVVVDRREDKDCDTGRFELAYKQPKLDVPAYVGIQLCVAGTAIPVARESSQRRVNVPVVKLTYTTGR